MSTERKFNFSAFKLKSLERPLRGRMRYLDDAVPGHCARITEAGVITLGLYRWFPNLGKPIDVTFGRFPALSITESRKLATEKIAELSKGINPNISKTKAKEEFTLGELYDSVCQNEFTHLKPITSIKYASVFRCHLEAWRTKKLSEITRQAVQGLHAKVGKDSGPYVANRLLALLSSLYSKARDRGFDKPNPAAHIKHFREVSRDRFVQPQEAKALFSAILSEPNSTMRDYLLISILCGARRSNILSMRWEDLDLAQGIWRLTDTKNYEPQLIPLVPLALKVLTDRQGNRSPFVFESPTSKSGHIEEPKSVWGRVLKRADISNLRIHDLRRTFGSWQAIGGSSLQVIGKSLNHKSYEATRTYARLNLDPIRDSVGKATDMLLKAGEVTLAEVVPFSVFSPALKS